MENLVFIWNEPDLHHRPSGQIPSTLHPLSAPPVSVRLAVGKKQKVLVHSLTPETVSFTLAANQSLKHWLITNCQEQLDIPDHNHTDLHRPGCSDHGGRDRFSLLLMAKQKPFSQHNGTFPKHEPSFYNLAPQRQPLFVCDPDSVCFHPVSLFFSTLRWFLKHRNGGIVVEPLLLSYWTPSQEHMAFCCLFILYFSFTIVIICKNLQKRMIQNVFLDGLGLLVPNKYEYLTKACEKFWETVMLAANCSLILNLSFITKRWSWDVIFFFLCWALNCWMEYRLHDMNTSILFRLQMYENIDIKYQYWYWKWLPKKKY